MYTLVSRVHMTFYVSAKGYTVSGNQGTHDKLNQIRLFQHKGPESNDEFLCTFDHKVFGDALAPGNPVRGNLLDALLEQGPVQWLVQDHFIVSFALFICYFYQMDIGGSVYLRAI